MAYPRSSSTKSGPHRGLTLAQGLRWVAAPGAGIAIALWSATVIAGIGSMGATLNAASGELSPRLLASTGFDRVAVPRTLARVARAPATNVSADKAGRLASNVAHRVETRFDAVVAQARLSHDKLAAVFASAGLTRQTETQGMPSATLPLQERFGAMADAGPAAERFGRAIAQAGKSFDVALAAIDPVGVEPSETVFSPLDDAGAASEPDDVLAESPDDSVPLPSWRPKLLAPRAGKPAIEPATRAASANPAPRSAAPKPVKPSRRLSGRGGDMLAYAPATEPDVTLGQAFRNLFTSPSKAGGGTAVYDISAKTVTMPDGTRLEAHSGIGAMADNPRYVDRKMTGPTPPDTYNLRMRETRFHGVEAIRLLPADGRTKHNRTGLLAHSYLLRGGRAESHGCIAFKDYPKFLAAFKKGKIKRLVVVPGRSGGTRVASAGRDA